MSEKVKVKAIIDFWAGKTLVTEGSTYETDVPTARELIADGIAEAVESKSK